MKQFVICDKRTDFLHDTKMRALLDEQDYVITEIADSLKFKEKQAEFAGQTIVVCENMLDELPEGFERFLQGSRLVGYCITQEGKKRFQDAGMKCIGKVGSSSQLLSMLSGFPDRKADSMYVDESEHFYAKNGKDSDDFDLWHRSIYQESQPLGSKQTEKSKVNMLLERRNERVNDEADILLKREKEAATPIRKTVAIAVVSPKGGVGKTTVATQLASCLALTSHGRGRFKTCIVDFDTAFGDVGTSLDYSVKGSTIDTWADDIRQKRELGESFDSITYSETEIKSFLRKKEESGLFALLAPHKYTECLDITADELTVIIRNLKQNAGFDYIVFDTGNDLKDTTLLAMENAEHVLLVATQDISCAHCIDMFIKTLEDISFDLSKVRLIINNIISAKSSGISVSELQETFDYPCWARIRYDPSVIRSNNYGKPIVYTSTHDMTKQMRDIVRRLNESEESLQNEKPKNMWQMLFFGREGK